MFYKIIENGYITMIGSPNVPSNGVEITEAKHIELSEKIKNKPEDTLEAVYRLSNETEEYIAIPRTHDETVDWYVQAVSSGIMTLEEVPIEYKSEVEAILPEPQEQKYTLDEAATIFAQEVNS